MDLYNIIFILSVLSLFFDHFHIFLDSRITSFPFILFELFHLIIRDTDVVFLQYNSNSISPPIFAMVEYFAAISDVCVVSTKSIRPSNVHVRVVAKTDRDKLMNSCDANGGCIAQRL